MQLFVSDLNLHSTSTDQPRSIVKLKMKAKMLHYCLSQILQELSDTSNKARALKTRGLEFMQLDH